MSELPKGWAEASVAEVGDLVRGVTFKKAESSTEPAEGLVPVIRAGNIRDADLVLDKDLIYVLAARVKDVQLLRVNDVVVASSSGSLSVVGKSALLKAEWHGAHGGFLTVVRPSSELSASYLGYWLQSPEIRQLWSKLSAGTSINNLKVGHFNETRVPLPPLAEQERIVAAIEEHFSHLDAAEASLRSAQKRVRLLSSAAWSAVADASWQHERLVDVLGARGSRQLRQGWSPQCEKFPSPDESAWGVLKTSAVQMGRFDESENKALPPSLEPRPALEVAPGDLIMTSGGPRSRIGVTCLVETCRPRLMLCDKMFSFQPDGERLDPRFLLRHLTSVEGLRAIERLKTGSNDSGLRISQKSFLGLTVPVPPIDVQHTIVRRASEVDDYTARTEQAVARSLRRVEGLRRSVLASAFHGELVPQDPDDEPASALLDRVRVGQREKAKLANRKPKTKVS